MNNINNTPNATQHKRSTAVIGTQWVVLSVLLLWLMSVVLSSLVDFDNVMPTSERVGILLGSYLFALCLPGLILVRTSLKNERMKYIMASAVAAAIVLTGLRFLEMTIERFDCNRDCANSIPYGTEMAVSLSLPFILTLVMYIIALLTKPKSLSV